MRRGQVGRAIAQVGLDRKTIGKDNFDKGAIDQKEKSKQGNQLGKDKEYAFYFKEGDNIDSLVEKRELCKETMILLVKILQFDSSKLRPPVP